jgi:DNA-binding response OmpR family regulator
MNPNETDEKRSQYDPSWGYYGQGVKDPIDTGAQGSKYKVLIVDDEEVNTRIIEAYLNKDYEIITAQNGREAMEKISKDKPDIVLLDIMMPYISGYDVCKSIKENEATRFMPVVMITALSGSEAKIKAIEIGAEGYLTKPINGIELITRVKSLLKKKYHHDQLVQDKENIEKQNKALSLEHDELEQKVHERTEELKKAKISSIKYKLNLK